MGTSHGRRNPAGRITGPPLMLILMTALVFLYHAAAGFYYAHDLEPPPALEFLYSAGLLCAVVWWMRADARRRGVTPVFCLGLLVYIGWMVVVPHHLLRTRGRRAGLLSLLALLGVFVLAQLVGALTYAFFAARPLGGAT